MQRRDFSKHLTLSAVALAVGSSLAPNAMAQGGPVAGKQYLVLSKPVATEAAAGQVEVIEFFWYSCPHCFHFEPTFEAWVKKQPKTVKVTRQPIAFRADFEPQQRLYFALQEMGLLDKLHAKVFNTIHVEKNPLRTDNDIFAWVEKQGVNRAKFVEAFKSFSTSNKVRRAVQLQNAYNVEGVPSFGVAGKYYLDGTMNGSMENALATVEYLMKNKR